MRFRAKESSSVMLPVQFLFRKVLFPFCSVLFEQKAAVPVRYSQGQKVLVMPVRNLFDVLWARKSIAVLAEVVEVSVTETVAKVLFKGIDRVRITERSGFKNAAYETVPISRETGTEAVLEELRKKSQELIFLINVGESDRLIQLLNYIADLGQLADFIANYFVVDFSRRMALFRELDQRRRAEDLITVLERLIQKMKLRTQETDEKKHS